MPKFNTRAEERRYLRPYWKKEKRRLKKMGLSRRQIRKRIRG